MIRGDSKRDLLSLKLKLDDFTSGFQTRDADMAGGWEEVVAVGSGIRTGVGLDKKNETDGAAEGKLAGRAPAK